MSVLETSYAHSLRMTLINCNELATYKLVCSYLKTFPNLSESDCSQSKLDFSCLLTGCLPLGDLCTCDPLAIKSGHQGVEDVANSTSG